MKKIIVWLLLIISMIGGNVYANSAKAIIVFDASGSMWGQIGHKAKITIAKDALKDVVKNWNSNTQLGLMVYGHRKKGDCNDIEVAVPVGSDNKQAILKRVAAISPKGKTPISKSLKLAADELKYIEDKATIILISDGKETCDTDPCATAKELKKQGIDFVTHVIGFNVDKSTDKQLECIANATGGEYFSAKNAKELNKAIKSVVKKVEVVVPPKPKPKKVKKLDHNIEVTASEKEGGKWIDASCRAYNEDKSDSWYVGARKKKAGTRVLPVGKYTLTCRYNEFKKENIPFVLMHD
jgi:Ca-activated chloride channel family protein